MPTKLKKSQCLRKDKDAINILSIIMEKLCIPERKNSHKPKTRPSTVLRITINTSRRPFRTASRKRRRYNRKALKQIGRPSKKKFDKAGCKYGRVKYGFA